ncbi:MAG: hypothetical protein R3F55_25475 [Alphaproteobacteria bacterium]
MLRTPLLSLYIMLALMQPAGAEANDAPPAAFFAGDYVLVGRLQDGGDAYAGSAGIVAADDDMLTIERTVDGETVRETGRFVTPRPPGEGRVLHLSSADGALVGSCLRTVDLDNDPRLTCLRAVAGTDPAEPGYEALFPAR